MGTLSAVRNGNCRIDAKPEHALYPPWCQGCILRAIRLQNFDSESRAPSPEPRQPAVKDIVLGRVLSRSQPGHREDHYRVGLCIEGGGMRGVVSAGMVRAIEQLGLLPAFDRVYGASAGAMNGAYLLAGQAALGTTIYYEDINNRSFIDLTRPLRGRPMVDIDFVIDRVMIQEKPLDADAVVRSPIPLSIIASDADAGTHVVLNATTPDALRRALRAGATIAVVAGPPYQLNHQRLWDAALTEPIPTSVARADGCTHVVVLLTRPAGVLRPGIGWFERHYIVPRIAKHSPQLARRHAEGRESYRLLMERLAESDTLLPIRPALPVVSKFEKNAERLIAGAERGATAVVNAFADRSLPTSPPHVHAAGEPHPRSSQPLGTSSAPQIRS